MDRKGVDNAQIAATLAASALPLLTLPRIPYFLDSVSDFRLSTDFMFSCTNTDLSSNFVSPENQPVRIFAVKQHGAFIRRKDNGEPFHFVFVCFQFSDNNYRVFYNLTNLTDDSIESKVRDFKTMLECQQYLSFTKTFFQNFKVDVLNFEDYVDGKMADELLKMWIVGD